MIPVDVMSVFALTSLLLALAPGPDNIFVLTQSALYGGRAGLAITLGLCTGILGHTVAVALGVAAIFQASATAFAALKAVGVAYLLYLAWGAFRAGAASLDAAESAAPAHRHLYGRGVVMNLTNPKVAIFFLAFLPQFADPARGPLVPQLLQLGAIFATATALVFGTVALGAGSLGRWLKRSARVQSTLNKVAGSVFVLLAGSLAISHR